MHANSGLRNWKQHKIIKTRYFLRTYSIRLPPQCVMQFVTQIEILGTTVSKTISKFQFKKYSSYDKHVWKLPDTARS